MAGVEGSGFQWAFSKDGENKVGPIYVSRPVLNNSEICLWYTGQGINTVDPESLHVTLVYSKEPIDWSKAWVAPEGMSIPANASRLHEYFPTQDGGEVMVMKIESNDLFNRHKDLRKAGCSHDYDSYKPHLTIAKGHQAVPLDSVEGFPGPIYFGPEAYGDVWENQEMEKSDNDPWIISIPVIIKAEISKSGERIIEVQASCEVKDLEGDIILQKALLDSADSFLKNGHLDIDHKSEPPVAHRLGITNPEYYIIGRPLEVKAGPNKSTFVKAEISRTPGSFDPEHRMADMVWDSLQRTPPVAWYASVYGFPRPGMTKNCRNNNCVGGATRWLIEGMDWKSLAMTRNPINNALKGAATIMTAKSWLAHLGAVDLLKGEAPISAVPMGGMPSSIGANSPVGVPTMSGLLAKGHSCKECGSVLHRAPSLAAWKRHLMNCEGHIPELAEIYSRAQLYDHLLSNIGIK